MYHFKHPVIHGRLIRRLNRFVAAVEVDGKAVHAHVANSGRMKELLFPGNHVILEDQSGKGRKTPYDLILAEYQGKLVSVDARLPNLLVAEAIRKGELPGFAELTVERREVIYGESRLDLKLRRRPDAEYADETGTAPGEGFAEIKSCTLVRDGVALFPDAPTERGARHLRELIRAQGEGYAAYAVFLVQREDASELYPNDATDPAFGMALREAAAAGVEVKAYTCRVTEDGVEIVREIPVCLSISI